MTRENGKELTDDIWLGHGCGPSDKCGFFQGSDDRLEIQEEVLCRLSSLGVASPEFDSLFPKEFRREEASVKFCDEVGGGYLECISRHEVDIPPLSSIGDITGETGENAVESHLDLVWSNDDAPKETLQR
jgi:hypothetical protein